VCALKTVPLSVPFIHTVQTACRAERPD